MIFNFTLKLFVTSIFKYNWFFYIDTVSKTLIISLTNSDNCLHILLNFFMYVITLSTHKESFTSFFQRYWDIIDIQKFVSLNYATC